MANYASQSVTLLVGDGSGALQLQGALTAGITTAGIVAADFNADGKMDLAASGARQAGLPVLLGHGDGTFDAPLMLGALPDSHFVAAADFNLDDRMDLVAGSAAMPVVGVFLNGCF